MKQILMYSTTTPRPIMTLSVLNTYMCLYMLPNCLLLMTFTKCVLCEI